MQPISKSTVLVHTALLSCIFVLSRFSFVHMFSTTKSCVIFISDKFSKRAYRSALTIAASVKEQVSYAVVIIKASFHFNDQFPMTFFAPS